jgi:periplasmic protein TonB
LKGCVESIKDESGHKSTFFHLRSQPVQELTALPPPPAGTSLAANQSTMNSDGTQVYRVGFAVTAPVPINTPEAHYSTAARKAKLQGDCWISLIVDANGLPQNIKVVRGLEPDLYQNAIDSVNKYRFKPAMKNGHPVAVMITIQVNFKLY